MRTMKELESLRPMKLLKLHKQFESLKPMKKR